MRCERLHGDAAACHRNVDPELKALQIMQRQFRALYHAYFTF